MILAAEHEFMLSEIQEDGEPLREHLEAVHRATGRKPPELDGPEMPQEADALWTWFIELNTSRQFNEAGPQAFSELDLWAWQQNTGRHLAHWEVAALRRLDVAFRKHCAGVFAKKIKAPPKGRG